MTPGEAVASRAEDALARERTLAGRVRAVLRAEMAVLADAEGAGGDAAADAALWRRVVAGAAPPVEPAVAAALPALLARYDRDLVAFWRADSSPSKVRTERVVWASASLVERLAKAASSPALRPVVDRALAG